ncbi:MAG TPA: endo-1,4-beta-xylanase [Prolixibacteraceae bacterium]|nr:endo-1,4-beta-xylanase [Prolixibacteraceae bacterium]
MNVIYKRLLSIRFLYLAVILSLITCSSFAQIVTNGSFESCDTGFVTTTPVKGWLLQASSSLSPSPEFKIVDDVVEQGNRALKVSIQNIGTNQWDIQAISDSIPAIPGATYNYSVWAKAEKYGAQVNFTVGNYSYSEYKAIRPATLSTEWQKFTMQFTVTDDQIYIRAPIHLSYSGSKNNTIYIDNLQISSVNFGKTPVVVEAESGVAGSKYTTANDGDITYITATENYTGMVNPGDTSRMITYNVTFEDSGYYSLYAHLRTGSGTYNDDSFFAAKGFGEKSATDSNWVFINGLAGAGFTAASEIVKEMGTAGSEVWKWVNITNNFFGTASNTTFYVSPDSLTKTFQIGSREDGLFFDKFAFGKANLYYTVDYLDKGLPGAESTPQIDSSNYYKGPALAKGLPKFLGNVMASDNIFANYWNQITPGNDGKWGTVAGSQDTTKWNWSSLDAIYNYAQKHDLIFKDHNLIWGQQQPSWISSLDQTTQLKYIETWFRQVGQRYPNMDMIDVVNEPFANHAQPDGKSDHANYKDALGGDGTTGWDWVIKAFELARKYMPKNTKLILNEYGVINDNSSTTSYLKIINLLKDRGLIDGIGIQGHRFEIEKSTTTTLKYNLDRLAETGIPIYISELDLGNIDNSGTPDDNQQLQLYQKLFPTLWQHPGVKGITLWGYVEGEMWQTSCYLVLKDGTWRPAMTWLADYIKNNPVGVEEIKNPATSDLTLEQNYPNPFSSSTTITFQVKTPSTVTLKVYNNMGQEVKTLVNKKMDSGTHSISWDATNNFGSKLGNGIYYYQLISGQNITSKKMLLNR